MHWRPTTALALGLWLVMIVGTAISTALSASGWQGAGDNSIGAEVTFTVAFLSFATMGALVAAHVPRNPLGWMFLAIALGAGVYGGVALLVFHNFVDAPGSIPAATFFAWLYTWLWYPLVGFVGFTLLLFPTGTLPGPRWRVVAWLLGVSLALGTVSYWVYPGRLDGDKRLPMNPLGMHWATQLAPLILAALVALLVAPTLSVIVRFRRSRGDERQQLKWMAFAAAVFALGLLVGVLANLPDIVTGVALALLPIALGIAIFKYRLYDIDRLISRTLVYGATTAVLGAAYVALVLGGQALFSTAAGGSHLLVAASTLVVAALFLPLRRRIQTFVDRRFYRRRYDAEQTLEAFSARLRQHVELETLGGGLLGVIDETMEPTHAELWLRDREAVTIP